VVALQAGWKLGTIGTARVSFQNPCAEGQWIWHDADEMNKAMLCAVLPLVIGVAIGQERHTAASRLYFDRFHGEFSPPDPLVGLARKLSLELVNVEAPISGTTLQIGDLLYLRAPSKAFSRAEKEAIVAFIKDGGSLLLVLDEEKRQSLATTASMISLARLACASLQTRLTFRIPGRLPRRVRLIDWIASFPMTADAPSRAVRHSHSNSIRAGSPPSHMPRGRNWKMAAASWCSRRAWRACSWDRRKAGGLSQSPMATAWTFIGARTAQYSWRKSFPGWHASHATEMRLRLSALFSLSLLLRTLVNFSCEADSVFQIK
jgi:hypothetical protein